MSIGLEEYYKDVLVNWKRFSIMSVYCNSSSNSLWMADKLVNIKHIRIGNRIGIMQFHSK